MSQQFEKKFSSSKRTLKFSLNLANAHTVLKFPCSTAFCLSSAGPNAHSCWPSQAVDEGALWPVQWPGG